MWRFKTEAEFLEEFGPSYPKNLGWTVKMDELFGEKITDHNATRILEEGKKRKYFQFCKLSKITKELEDYSVCNHMITDKPLPNPVIPDPIPDATHRFKTKQEFMKEFGEDWSRIGWNRHGRMDYLFGLHIDNTRSQLILTSDYLEDDWYPELTKGDADWNISSKMITPITKSKTQPSTPQEHVTSSRTSKPIEVQSVDFTVPSRKRIGGNPISY